MTYSPVEDKGPCSSYDLTFASRALISSSSSSSSTPSALASSYSCKVKKNSTGVNRKKKKEKTKKQNKVGACNVAVVSHTPLVQLLMSEQAALPSPFWLLQAAVQQSHLQSLSRPYQLLLLSPLLYPLSPVLCQQHHSQTLQLPLPINYSHNIVIQGRCWTSVFYTFKIIIYLVKRWYLNCTFNAVPMSMVYILIIPVQCQASNIFNY